MNPDTVLRLYPAPNKKVELKGLYLHAGNSHDNSNPHVYTNFIASLDGRIAIEQPVSGKRGVPRSITNPRDWRLYQELAARADVLLVSARYLRELAHGTAQADLPVSNASEFADLRAWRTQQGLPPQPHVVVLSASLDLPCDIISNLQPRKVFVATGDQAGSKAVSRIEQHGAIVVRAGEGKTVDGTRLIERLVQEGFHNIYSIAGPGVLETLLRARVVNCIYLTQVHRLLGGTSYDTLLEGNLLQPPSDFKLQTLYYDDHHGETCVRRSRRAPAIIRRRCCACSARCSSPRSKAGPSRR